MSADPEECSPGEILKFMSSEMRGNLSCLIALKQSLFCTNELKKGLKIFTLSETISSIEIKTGNCSHLFVFGGSKHSF